MTELPNSFYSGIPVVVSGFTDYLKNPIEIGDKVVFVRQGYREFSKGFIKRFTPKMVIIEDKNYTFDNKFKQLPSQVIKIG